jgi:hypothetical protein
MMKTAIIIWCVALMVSVCCCNRSSLDFFYADKLPREEKAVTMGFEDQKAKMMNELKEKSHSMMLRV